MLPSHKDLNSDLAKLLAHKRDCAASARAALARRRELHRELERQIRKSRETLERSYALFAKVGRYD
jgi:hypothetical protein